MLKIKSLPKSIDAMGLLEPFISMVVSAVLDRDVRAVFRGWVQRRFDESKPAFRILAESGHELILTLPQVLWPNHSYRYAELRLSRRLYASGLAPGLFLSPGEQKSNFPAFAEFMVLECGLKIFVAGTFQEEPALANRLMRVSKACINPACGRLELTTRLAAEPAAFDQMEKLKLQLPLPVWLKKPRQAQWLLAELGQSGLSDLYLYIKEGGSSMEDLNIEAALNLGSIQLKMEDLCSLRPGMRIEFERPFVFEGAIQVNGTDFALVSISIDPKTCSLEIKKLLGLEDLNSPLSSSTKLCRRRAEQGRVSYP